MLDLAGSTRTVAGVILAPDTGGPSTWYVMPATPHPAVGPNGPDVQLLRVVRDGQLSGGYLRLGITLGVDDRAIAAATAALTEEVGKPVTLSPLPVLSAEADVAFYGRETTQPGTMSPLVLRRYGTSTFGFAAPHYGAFAIDLTAEGVRLVEAGLRSGATPIGVTCRLTAEGLWPAVRVTARVDWRSVYDHFSENYRVGALLVGTDISHLMQDLQQRSAVQVSVIQSPVPGAEVTDTSAAVANALDFVQSELVDRFCRPVLPLDTEPARASLGSAGELFNLGAAYEVKALTQIETASGFYDFSQATVAQRVLISQAPLGDLLGGTDPAGVIVDAAADDPFFTRFHLDCRTARPLADTHLAEAILDVRYGSADSPIRLTADAPAGGFDSYADASADHSWLITARVTFAPDSPIDPGTIVDLPAVPGTSRDVTLDLDAALGLVRLDVEGPTDQRVIASAVTVTQTSRDVARTSRQLSVTPAAPTASAWFRDHRAADTLTVSGLHLLADGRQVPIAPTLADTALFRLPNPYAGSFTVQIVTDAVWTELTQVIVAISKDESAPVRTFSFDAPAIVAIALDQSDPTDRTYRYQIRRIVDGVTSEDPWLTSDLPLLAVGRVRAGDLVVDVQPVGPELTSVGLRQVVVDLLYLDVTHQLRAEHTVVISAKADRYRWEVHLADPAQRSYQYRITKLLLTGESRPGGWVDSSDPILPVAITAS